MHALNLKLSFITLKFYYPELLSARVSYPELPIDGLVVGRLEGSSVYKVRMPLFMRCSRGGVNDIMRAREGWEKKA